MITSLFYDLLPTALAVLRDSDSAVICEEAVVMWIRGHLDECYFHPVQLSYDLLDVILERMMFRHRPIVCSNALRIMSQIYYNFPEEFDPQEEWGQFGELLEQLMDHNNSAIRDDSRMLVYAMQNEWKGLDGILPEEDVTVDGSGKVELLDVADIVNQLHGIFVDEQEDEYSE